MEPLQLINPRHLATFVKIAETHTFAQAAAQLHMTQPAITQHVRALEDALGAGLFIRSAAGLSLTPAGQVLHTYAKRFLELSMETHAAVRDAAEIVQAHLRLAVGLTIANTALPSVLVEFRNHHPKVHVDLTTGTTENMIRTLQEKQADLAIVSTPSQHHSLQIFPLYDDYLILVVPVGHPWCQRTSIPAEEVALEPFVLFWPGSVYRPMIDEFCNHLGFQPMVSLELDSVEAVKRMTEAGLGVAMVPHRSTLPELNRGSLVALPIDKNIPRIHSPCAVLRKEAYVSRPMRAFLALLKNHFGRDFQLPAAH